MGPRKLPPWCHPNPTKSPPLPHTAGRWGQAQGHCHVHLDSDSPLFPTTLHYTMHPAPRGQALNPLLGWHPAQAGWVHKDLPRTTCMRAPDKQNLMMMSWFSWLKPRPGRLMKSIQHSNTRLSANTIHKGILQIVFKVEKENNNIKGKSCQKKLCYR